jgi:hypothetical protein
MAQPACRLCPAQEANAHLGRIVRADGEGLHGDAAVELRIPREVDGARAALAEHALDDVLADRPHSGLLPGFVNGGILSGHCDNPSSG